MRVPPFAALALVMFLPAAGALAGPDAGPAGPLTREARTPCFTARDVSNFQAVSDTVVNLRVGARDVYQIELFAPAREIDWSSRIGLETRGGRLICSALDAELIAPSDFGPRRIPLRSLRRLTAEEVQALPPRQRP